ncbi:MULTISPECIES: alkane oxidation protein activator PraB [Pseudomonas]|uniref:alkane oxidation protein activator PraB n=1 Tax=Pseudomonas TaxID=286 RepID=UPI000C0837BC|nr:MULTISPECIES: alkane oxidation protein activator PraB [Pseudomonas]
MKSLKNLISLSAFAICLGAASMASAVTVAPAGAAFSTPAGAISVSSPASFGVPVSCTINFSGSVASNGASATITNATVSGSNPLCGLPTMLGLPWTLTPTGTGSNVFAGTVSGVNFNILGNCASSPTTIAVTFNNSTNTLSIPSTQTVGKCKISALNVKPTPAFTVSP